MGAAVAFWLLAPVMVLGALGMILARKPVHSALCLAAVMISLAVQYAALDAPFLFAVQIIVYTGAILMLFLFVLMLVGVDAADSLVETIKRPAAARRPGRRRLRAAARARRRPRGRRARHRAEGGQRGVRRQRPGPRDLIFTKYVFAFEATSALLITAAVGAMVLAHRERLTKRKTQGDLVGERMRRYAETGQHPGPLPTPGVFARHNAVDTPALLPDGTPRELSVSATLRNRSGQPDRRDLVAPDPAHDHRAPGGRRAAPGHAARRRADPARGPAAARGPEHRSHRGDTPGPGAEPDGGTE